MAKKADSKPTYSLTKEEKQHLEAIQGMMSYLTQVVRQDMSRYVDLVVKKRLDVSEDKHLVVDIQKGVVTIEEMETPNAEEPKE